MLTSHYGDVWGAWGLRSAPDSNAMHVAPNDNAHPHAAFFADLHLADDLSAVVDESSGVDVRRSSTVGSQHRAVIIAS